MIWNKCPFLFCVIFSVFNWKGIFFSVWFFQPNQWEFFFKKKKSLFWLTSNEDDFSFFWFIIKIYRRYLIEKLIFGEEKSRSTHRNASETVIKVGMWKVAHCVWRIAFAGWNLCKRLLFDDCKVSLCWKFPKNFIQRALRFRTKLVCHTFHSICVFCAIPLDSFWNFPLCCCVFLRYPGLLLTLSHTLNVWQQQQPTNTHTHTDEGRGRERNFSAKLLSPNYFVNFQLCNFPAFELLSNIIFNLFARQTTMWRTLSGIVRLVYEFGILTCASLQTSFVFCISFLIMVRKIVACSIRTVLFVVDRLSC